MIMLTSSHEWNHECVIAEVQGNITPNRVSRFSARFLEHFFATRQLFGKRSRGRNIHLKRSITFLRISTQLLSKLCQYFVKI